MDDLEDESENQSGGGFQVEQLRSYLAFAKRAIRKRWGVAIAVIVSGLGLTGATAAYWPKTYECSTVLMAFGNAVLDGRDGTNALGGASDLILRHQNLESMIRDTGLLINGPARRPPLLHLKDKIISSLFGPMDEKTQIASLIGTLEVKIIVTTDNGNLTIKVLWSDPRTAMELAAAARESFVRARRTAEMSAFEEKVDILEANANKLRDEVGVIANQLKAARDEQLEQARAEQSHAKKAAAAASDEAGSARAARTVIVRRPEPDAALPDLRDKLRTLQAQLASTQADRDKRLQVEQAKLEDLKLRLTPSHPEVVTQAERVAMLSQVPSEVALMQAEVKDLQGEIQQREAADRQAGALVTPSGGGPGARDSAAALLPPDIINLLDRDSQVDPALTAQLSSAVSKYGMLRSDIFSTRVDLDTAQAAFNHRYQVIVPAERPRKASKPKVAVIYGAGFFLSLLLGLLVPILSELRRDVIIESWQVEHIRLPVLAELRLPPNSTE